MIVNFKKYKYFYSKTFDFVIFISLLLLSAIFYKFTCKKNDLRYKINNMFLNFSSPIYFVVKMPFNFLNNFYIAIDNMFFYEKLNRKLISENDDLKTRLKELEILKAENNELKKKINYKNIDNKYLISKVYFKFVNENENVVTLKVGLKDGIKEHTIVLGDNNNFIGRLVNVQENYSNLLLINSLKSNIPARSLKNNEKLILTGYKSNLLKISYFMSENLNIEDGEEVVSCGDGGFIEDNIYIGKAKKINNEYYIEIDKINLTNFVKILLK